MSNISTKLNKSITKYKFKRALEEGEKPYSIAQLIYGEIKSPITIKFMDEDKIERQETKVNVYSRPEFGGT